MRTRLPSLAWTIVCVAMLALSPEAAAGGARKPQADRTGEITGRVTDGRNGQPVPGATVRVDALDIEVVADAQGVFAALVVPEGTYTVVATAPGYETSSMSGVVVRDAARAEVTFELRPAPVRLEEQVDVVALLPRRSQSQPGDAFTLTGTELTTLSGTMGDFGRMLRAVPAAGGISDERNTIIARGGNPVENGFFIDNIEVPNTSHMPDNGSTGGFYSLVDPAVVRSFDFIVGGFPAQYGGFLSSITDIAYREGSRDHVTGHARFDIAMGAAGAEGPLPGKRGSWLVSARHADFVYLKEIIDLENGDQRWTDAHVKVVYDLTPRHALSLLDVYSSDRQISQQDGGYHTRHDRIDQNTVGVNWTAAWSGRLRSRTSVAWSSMTRAVDHGYAPPDSAYGWGDERAIEWLAVRNENHLAIGATALTFGLQAKRLDERVAYTVVPSRPGTVLFSTGPWTYRTTETAAFLTGSAQPLDRLAATAGLRVEHSTAGGRTHLSPRFSASFRLTDAVRVNGAAALVYQPIPAEFLAVDPRSVALRDMRAVQYSLGASVTGPSGWRATIEAYDKSYSGLPIDPQVWHRLILDREPFRDYTIPIDLVDSGTGRARGVELMLERRTRRLSGVAVATLSRNRYRDARGIERTRLYDSRYAFTLAASYAPADRWSLSGSLVVQGGTPYTPTHEEASAAWGFWVRRGAQYNTVRYPPYASLNLRAERRFAVGRTTIAVYADVWNVLNRQNVGWITGWNPVTGDEFEYQMPRTPFVGAGIVF